MTTTDDRTEEILEPELPIVDPHHHLWDWPAAMFAALPPPRHSFEKVVRMSTRYLLDQLLADLRTGHNIRATVFVQCGAMYRADAAPAFKPVGETEFVNGVAAMCASGAYAMLGAAFFPGSATASGRHSRGPHRGWQPVQRQEGRSRRSRIQE